VPIIPIKKPYSLQFVQTIVLTAKSKTINGVVSMHTRAAREPETQAMAIAAIMPIFRHTFVLVLTCNEEIHTPTTPKTGPQGANKNRRVKLAS